MIAFHFPPQAGSSGVQRTLKFAQYLPQFGWEPTVLTAHPRAYLRIDQKPSTPAIQCDVHRAFALDSSRHLAIKGRYSQLTALPDRWATWWLGAVPRGRRLLREQKFDAIWSTYPIATAHMIALTLQRRAQIPWIADFRDPMTEPGFPPDPRMHRAYGAIERATIARCDRAIFTTEGSRRAYLNNFPAHDGSRFNVIENGYDEEDFEQALTAKGENRPFGKRFVLLHSGIVYPSERDPRPLFEALAVLRRSGAISADNFVLVLRASANEHLIQQMIDTNDIAELVMLMPPIPYQAALSEMQCADGLLLLQAANCNNQIPAKMYEYLRAQRPVLALTDSLGDTATALRKAGIDTIAPLDRAEHIASALHDFIARVRSGDLQPVPLAVAQANSRRDRTRGLAEVLDIVTSAKPIV